MNNPEEFTRRAVLQELVPYEELWPNTASRGKFLALRKRFPDADEFIAHCNEMQQKQIKKRIRTLRRFIRTTTGTPSDYARINAIQRSLWYRSTEITGFNTDLISLINHVAGHNVVERLTTTVRKAKHIIRFLDTYYSQELPRRGRRDLPFVLDVDQERDYWKYMKKYGLSEPDTDNDSDSDEYWEGDDMFEEDEVNTDDYESEAEFTDDE